MKPEILLVDDEASVRDLLAAFLRRHGFRVTTATSANEAWRIVGEEKFDLAILDVVLPRENGMQLLAGLKEAHPNLPVIMLTGTPRDDAMAKEALRLGAARFLWKNMPLAGFLEEVRLILKPQNPDQAKAN